MKQLNIFEIGPGTGSNADSILEFLKNYNLDIYRECNYILVEISPQLSQMCEDLLSKKHKSLYDNDQIRVINSSIFDFDTTVKETCFVVGMEILDNMPHDRLFLNQETGRYDQQSVIKVTGDPSKADGVVEV